MAELESYFGQPGQGPWQWSEVHLCHMMMTHASTKTQPWLRDNSCQISIKYISVYTCFILNRSHIIMCMVYHIEQPFSVSINHSVITNRFGKPWQAYDTLHTIYVMYHYNFCTKSHLHLVHLCQKCEQKCFHNRCNVWNKWGISLLTNVCKPHTIWWIWHILL